MESDHKQGPSVRHLCRQVSEQFLTHGLRTFRVARMKSMIAFDKEGLRAAKCNWSNRRIVGILVILIINASFKIPAAPANLTLQTLHVFVSNPKNPQAGL